MSIKEITYHNGRTTCSVKRLRETHDEGSLVVTLLDKLAACEELPDKWLSRLKALKGYGSLEAVIRCCGQDLENTINKEPTNEPPEIQV
jgi:hypothetical protein